MRNKISFLDFKKVLINYPVLSTTDIYKAFPDVNRRRLHEWVTRGLMTNISRGYYLFSDIPVTESLLYLVSNRIYEPSYISLQSALNWYGLIPEFVPQVTAVSTKKTTQLNTKIGNFSYLSVKGTLMFGYDLIPSKDLLYKVKMAYPEKALLDFFYLNPNIEATEQFSELRINAATYKEKVDPKVLLQYLEIVGIKTLTKRVTNFMEFMNNA